jgi:hypothetical protein
MAEEGCSFPSKHARRLFLAQSPSSHVPTPKDGRELQRSATFFFNFFLFSVCSVQLKVQRKAWPRGAMMAAIEQQKVLYKDFAAFQSVFPEVQQAIKMSIAKLIQKRPADPIAFLAICLREANEEIKLEKAFKEKEKKEQAAAATRIQSIGRAKKDKARVHQIKINNGIFVREL